MFWLRNYQINKIVFSYAHMSGGLLINIQLLTITYEPDKFQAQLSLARIKRLDPQAYIWV